MDPTPLETLFAALDLSTLSGSVSAALVLCIGVGLLFTGYKFIKRIQRVA